MGPGFRLSWVLCKRGWAVIGGSSKGALPARGCVTGCLAWAFSIKACRRISDAESSKHVGERTQTCSISCHFLRATQPMHRYRRSKEVCGCFVWKIMP